MLEREFAYFKKHHDELYKEHPNEYVVIAGEEVLFAEKSFEAAIARAMKSGLEAGHYLVQLCSEGDSAYTQTFHSRVVFA